MPCGFGRLGTPCRCARCRASTRYHPRHGPQPPDAAPASDRACARSRPVAPSRRRFLANAGALAASAALPAMDARRPAAAQARVVIVGAGLAGLAAAYTLAKAGVRATLYEGSPRIGGRCWTDRESFADGQVAERGGELIDTSHEEIRALCAEFGLPLDDLIAAEAKGSEPMFFFDGAAYTTADVDRDFAAVRPRLAAGREDRWATTCRPTTSTRRRSASSTACRPREWIDIARARRTRVAPRPAARQRLRRRAGRRPRRDQRDHRRVAPRGLARRPLLAVRGVRPALPRPRRQRPDRHQARRRRSATDRDALAARGAVAARRRPLSRGRSCATAPSARTSPIA